MTLSRPWDPFSPHLPEAETPSTESMANLVDRLKAEREISEPDGTESTTPESGPDLAVEPPKPEPAPTPQTKQARTRGSRAGRKTVTRKRAAPKLDEALRRMEGQ